MKKLSVIFILLISLTQVNAQAPSRFYCRYGGTGEDVGYSAKPTMDGQYIIAGSSSSYGSHGQTDVYLMKLDSMGFPMWEKYFGGSGNEVAKSIIQLPDSGYAMAGFTDSYGAGGFDAFIIRVDKDGNQLWQKTFGGTEWDFASDLVQAIDGGIFVVGNTFSFGNGKKDGFIIKYDMAGNLLIQKFIGGTEDDELRSIIVTNDLNLATVGYTESRGEINGDGYFAKLDLNGDTLFTKTFGGPYKDYACDLVQKGSSSEHYDYVIVGARTHLFPDKTNSYIYRMSTSGNFVSELDNYNSSGNENWESVANCSAISYLTGFLRTIPVAGASEQGNIMVKYPNGYDHTINSFGGIEDEYCYSLEGTKDGGYIITGLTVSYASLGTDIYFIKIDSNIVATYSSVVGVIENTKNKNISISYKNDSNVNISFPSNSIPKTGTLCGLNGIIYKKFEQIDQVLEVDLTTFDPGLYIIQFQFSNGQFYQQKLINR